MTEDLIREVERDDRGAYTVTLAHGYTLMARRVGCDDGAHALVQVFANGEGRIWLGRQLNITTRGLASGIRRALDGAEDLTALADSPSPPVAAIGEAIQDHLETEANPGGGDGE